MRNFLREWLRQSPKAGIGYKGLVTVEHRNAAGELVSRQTVKNTVLNGGLDWLKAQACGAGADYAVYIGLSSGVGAPAVGDTDLGATVYTSNGLERALGVYAAGATGVCTVLKTGASGSTVFTNAGGQHTVASVGLYYKSSGAGMFAGVAITAAVLETGDTLAVTWTATFTAA
jgi:hypothetical protein